eukprot:Clim_evm19s66 gene=Clim_evmTU19s66
MTFMESVFLSIATPAFYGIGLGASVLMNKYQTFLPQVRALKYQLGKYDVDPELFPFVCILALQILVTVSYWPFVSLTALYNGKSKFTNAHPRGMERSGLALRIYSAHQNNNEAMAPFLAAVLIGTATGVPSDTLDHLCMSFVIMRVLYMLAYYLNLDLVRSLCYCTGQGVIYTIYINALFPKHVGRFEDAIDVGTAGVRKSFGRLVDQTRKVLKI